MKTIILLIIIMQKIMYVSLMKEMDLWFVVDAVFLTAAQFTAYSGV